MFPKRSKDNPHGHEGLWLATFWLFNIGWRCGWWVSRCTFSGPRLCGPAGGGGNRIAVVGGMALAINTWGG
jgi:hypothetical protein